MSWTTALTRWPHLLDQLCAQFRYLERAALIRFRGDRAKLNLYLAQTHDLTVDEAAEALDDWLRYSATHVADAAAA